MDTLSAVYTDSCYVTFAAKWCEQGQRVSVSGRAVRLMNGGTEMQNMIITCGREGAGARLTSFWAGNSPTIGPGTHTYTHTGQFDFEWTHPQCLNEARESSRYSQESISLDRTCTDTLCLFGASTVSRSCRDTDGRVDAQRVAGNIVANGIINTTEIWSSIRYLNGHI